MTLSPVVPIESGKKREPLNRDKIAHRALKMIEEVGLENLSTRRLGKALGVEGMALYKHFESIDALLDAVVELMLSEVALPPKGPPWSERVRMFARSLRALARMYPKAYPLLATRRLNTKRTLQTVDQIFAALLDEGFSAPEAALLFRTIGNFCNGTALDELAILAHLSSGQARDVVHEEVDRYLHPTWFDAHFEAGLDLLLDGFQRRRRGGKKIRK